MASVDTEAIVLRALRYSEADAVLSLLTRDQGRVSAIVKGARRTTSKLGGRLQPGVRAHVTLHRGRGEMFTVRGAAVLDAHAGLWVEGHRLQAAGCVLEAVMRVTPEAEPAEETWNLLCRALDELSVAAPAPGPARLHPLVLAVQVKLMVIAGLLPVLNACVRCGAPGPLVGFAPAAGGAVCERCAQGSDPVEQDALDAVVALVGNPLSRAPGLVPPGAGAGVERIVALVLAEHLGVRLRSAAPL